MSVHKRADLASPFKSRLIIAGETRQRRATSAWVIPSCLSFRLTSRGIMVNC